MTIISVPRKPFIDLRGPAGNAFALIGNAQEFARKLGWTEDQIEHLVNDMQSGDYEHLVEVFDFHFGDYIDLMR